MLGIVKGLIAWFKANRAMIRQKVEMVAHILAAALKGVAKAVGLVLDGVTFLNDHWEQAKWFIYALVAALAVYEAATIAAGIASAVSWLIGLWPLGLLLLAIGAVVLIIEDLYQYFTGGDSVFGTFLDAIKKYIGIDAVGTVSDAVALIKFLFLNWFDTMKMIFSYVSASFDLVKTGVQAVWKVVKPVIDAIREGVGYVDDLTGSVANPFGGNFGGSGTNLIKRPETDASRNQQAALTQFFGGGGAAIAPTRASPAAAGGFSNLFHATITVHATGGADGDDIAIKMNRQLEAFWDTKVREMQHGEES